MPTIKVHRGENALLEGTALYAFRLGDTPAPYDLTNANVFFHVGTNLSQGPIFELNTTGTGITKGTNVGVYYISLVPAHTELLVGSLYYFDLWLKTQGGNEYVMTVGTFELQGVVGTI